LTETLTKKYRWISLAKSRSRFHLQIWKYRPTRGRVFYVTSCSIFVLGGWFWNDRRNLITFA